MDKYLYSQFQATPEYRNRIIEFLRYNTNAEIGGYKLYDGTGTHYMQNPVEITDLIFALKDLEKKRNKPLKSFLEIGYSAGINNTFLHKFFSFSNLVAVDIVCNSGVNTDTFYANLRFKNMSLICGNSMDPNTVKRAGLLGGYDLIFIDGGHSYETVKADYRNYKEFLNPGGAIVLHDICAPDCPGVAQFWKELQAEEKNRWKYSEFAEFGNHTTYGIGLIVDNR